jgi:hypothetical protein
MGKLFTLSKWCVKFGVVGGAVYLAQKEGFFGDAKQASEAYQRLRTSVVEHEYFKMIPELEMPKEIRDNVPNAEKVREYRAGFRQHWNSGVLYTFDKIDHLPEVLKSYAADGRDYLSKMSQQQPQTEQQQHPKSDK